MAFGAVFHPIFRPAFDPGGAVVTPPAADWWEAGGAPTPLAVYQPKGAASLAASYVNLVNPGTSDIDPQVAPGWSSEAGWSSDGTQWLKAVTDFSLAADQSQAVLVRYSGASNIALLVGLGTSVGTFGVTPIFYSGRLYTNGNTTYVGNNSSAGVMAVAGNRGYFDGVAEGDEIAPDGLPNSGAIGIFRAGSGSGDIAIANIQAVAIWDTSTGHATWMPAVMAAVALI